MNSINWHCVIVSKLWTNFLTDNNVVKVGKAYPMGTKQPNVVTISSTVWVSARQQNKQVEIERTLNCT